MKHQGRAEAKERVQLLLLLVSSCIVIFGYLIWSGNVYIYLDVGSDTIHSFYPIYRMAAQMLRNRSFHQWSFSIGMGASIFNYTSVVMDPFAWPVILAGAVWGPQVINGMLVAMQITKIFISGLLCFYFLKLHHFTGFSLVMAAYGYSFNGFLIVWGQHYWLGTACVWIMLELIGLEKSIRDRKFTAGLVISTAGMLMQSVYVGYMSLLAGAVYALFRISAYREKKGVREWWSYAWPPVASVLCGFLISMVTFLPTAYIILRVSGRVPEEGGVIQNIWHWLKQPLQWSEIREICNRFLSSNIHGTGDNYSMKYADAGRAEVVRYMLQNYYEIPQLFFSCLFPVLAVIWAWERIFLERDKKWQIRRILSVFLVGFLIFVPVGSMVMNGFAYPFGRYTFVLMPFFSIVMADGLQLIMEKKYPVALMWVVSLLLMAICWKRSEYYMGQGTGYILKSAAAGILLFALAITGYRYGRQNRWKEVLVVISLAVIWGNVTADSFVTTNERGLASKDISWMQEDSMTDVKEALSWLAETDTSLYRVEKNFVSISVVTDPVALQYYGVTGYNTMVSKGMQQFYRNLWQDILAGGDPYRQYYIDVWREWQQSALCGVKYLLSEEGLEVPEPYEELAQFGNVIIYRNPYVDTMGYVFASLPGEEEMQELSWGESAYLILYYLKQQVGTVSLQETDGQISGQIEAEAEGYVYVSIPKDAGWTIWLDDEKVDPETAFYGFMAIPVTEGTHTICMSYRAPGLYLGIGLSGAGLLLFGMGMITEHKKTRKGKIVQKINEKSYKIR
jgi:uncharacterized membrane protein YfhO